MHWAVDELPLILDGTLKLLLLCRTSHSPHGKFYPLAGGKEVGYIYWLQIIFVTFNLGQKLQA